MSEPQSPVNLKYDDFSHHESIAKNNRFSPEQISTLFDTFCTFKDRNSEYLNLDRLITCMEMFKEEGRKEIKLRLLENLGERFPRGIIQF